MTAFGSQTLTYDNNGNLINDGATNFGWDARNRLISMTGAGVNANFQYDSIGRRATKTISGISTSFLYNGQTPIQELSGTTPTANLLTGLGIDEYITRTDSVGTRTLLTDALGSTLALSDDAGAVQTQYTYEPFGRTSATGQNNSNPFQYTGRENDGTGFYYYRARYYSPELARFFSEDPLYSPMYNTMKCRGSFAPTVSRYIEHDQSLLLISGRTAVFSLGVHPQKIHYFTYADDNPINKIDPTGLAAQVAGCDFFPDFMETPCVKKCCDAHDDCYQRTPCTWGTWRNVIPNPGLTNRRCDECNSTVAKCIWNALMSDSMSGRSKC